MSENEQCPIHGCNAVWPSWLILDVRGRKGCLKCQIEFLWDFTEGTRRLMEQGHDESGVEPIVSEERKYTRVPHF